MNAIINYIVEANIGLIFFMAIYWLGLRNENQFAFNRAFLLLAILFSLTFPLIHISSPWTDEVIPTFAKTVSIIWLPEIIVGVQDPIIAAPGENLWPMLSFGYLAVTGLLLGLFFYRVAALIALIVKTPKTHWNRLFVAESQDIGPTFSFFNFIFIAQAEKLNADEKEKILRHELIHVRKLHSIDRLAADLLRVVFWFNPITGLYKTYLIQLHEYEADAETVAWTDRESYCSLLARIALQSTEFSLANHFNSSLTLKRIAMMNAMKKRIQTWKLIPITTSIALFFIVIACQEQVMSDLKEINKNSAATEVYPAEIQANLNALQKANPEKQYVVLVLNDEAKIKADRMGFENAVSNSAYPSMNLFKTKDGQAYAIIEKNDQTLAFSKSVVTRDSVYTVVDETPEYPGGIDSLVAFLQKNVHYPAIARKAGVQGKVLVQFVVASNGNVIDPDVIKGVSPELNDEALRVVKMFPYWTPGKQQGKAVNVRYVLPINFKI